MTGEQKLFYPLTLSNSDCNSFAIASKGLQVAGIDLTPGLTLFKFKNFSSSTPPFVVAGGGDMVDTVNNQNDLFWRVLSTCIYKLAISITKFATFVLVRLGEYVR